MKSGGKDAWVEVIKTTYAASPAAVKWQRRTAELARKSSKTFSTVWLVLGAVLVVIGAFALGTGTQLRSGTILPGNPVMLLVAGMALATYGLLTRRD